MEQCSGEWVLVLLVYNYQLACTGGTELYTHMKETHTCVTSVYRVRIDGQECNTNSLTTVLQYPADTVKVLLTDSGGHVQRNVEKCIIELKSDLQMFLAFNMLVRPSRICTECIVVRNTDDKQLCLVPRSIFKNGDFFSF